MSRRDANTTKVFVGSLPAAVTTEDLRRLFTPYGKIVECDIANRCGFLHLEDKDLAEKAIEELNNTNFMGGRISVEKGRVKPPRRSRDGGPMRGGRDRGGPYSREDAYARGPPRNGMGGYGGARDYSYGDRYGEYDRGAPVRSYATEYDSMGERRSMYDDRRGYMDDRRAYPPPNGYERRSYDDRAAYPDDRSGYDDRRLPPGPGAPVPNSYDDRRPLLTDRRPLIDQGASRTPMAGYDRGSSASDMFSRRGDSGPKPGLPPASGGYGDRDSSLGYGSSGVTGSGYSSVNDGGYGNSASGLGTGYSGVGASSYGSTTGYGSGGYGDTRSPSGGYGGSSGGQTSAAYGNGSGTGAYSSSGATGGYGDSYSGSRVGATYDTVYPIPQQRRSSHSSVSGPENGGHDVNFELNPTDNLIFASSAGGPGPRRDIPSGPGRRY